MVSTEYRHQTITPTILAVPRRPRLVLAKWLVTALYAVLYGLVGLGVAFAVTVLILSARGIELNLGADGLPRAMALALLAFVLWGLIGVGVGTLVGNQVVAILLGIGFIFIEFIAQVALGFVSWGPDLVKWLPERGHRRDAHADDGHRSGRPGHRDPALVARADRARRVRRGHRRRRSGAHPAPRRDLTHPAGRIGPSVPPARASTGGLGLKAQLRPP